MKRILAALLPFASREQILGDLEERGFRLRDILSVLPGAWIAQLHREWLGPVPSLADASDNAIRLRTEQLRRRGSVEIVIGLWAVQLAFIRPMQPDFPRLLLIGLVPLVAILARLWMGGGPHPITSLMPSRNQLLDNYRSILRASGGGTFLLMGLVPRIVTQLSVSRPWQLLSALAALVLIAMLLHRARRNYLELRNLSHPPSKNPMPLA